MNFYFDIISSYISDRVLSFLRAHISLDVVSGQETLLLLTTFSLCHYAHSSCRCDVQRSVSIFTMHSKNFTNREHVGCTLNGKQIRTGPRVSIQNISLPSTKN